MPNFFDCGLFVAIENLNEGSSRMDDADESDKLISLNERATVALEHQYPAMEVELRQAGEFVQSVGSTRAQNRKPKGPSTGPDKDPNKRQLYPQRVTVTLN